MKYPILMADVLQSSKKNPRQLMQDFHEIIAEINRKHKASVISPLTITLGDEFQGIIKSIESALTIIFDIEERLIRSECDFKLRYVLNLGKINTEINSKIAYEMLGPGLKNAREMLTDMKKRDSRFRVNTDRKEKDYYTNSSFSVLQSIMNGWNKKDLAAVNAFLKHEDYKVVAGILRVDKSSAWRREKTLMINEYKSLKELILYIACS